MKTFESLPSESALHRLVLAHLVAGLIVLAAVLAAPPVTDSIATLNLSAAQLAEWMDDDAEPAVGGIDVQQTHAAPVEPLSTSY